MRKFRNKFTYEEPGILISRKELENSINSAEELISKISIFIENSSSQRKLGV